MKTKLLSYLMTIFALFAFVATVYGQDIPKAKPTVVTPRFGEVEHIFVRWTSVTLDADVLGSEVKNLRVSVVNTNTWSVTDYTESPLRIEKLLVNVSEWKKLAYSLASKFRPIGDPQDELLYETDQYVVLGFSKVTQHGELPESAKTMILIKGDDYLAFRLDEWHGEVPEVGMKLLVGRTCGGQDFFPVVVSNNETFISSEMTEWLAKERAERAKYTANLNK